MRSLILLLAAAVCWTAVHAQVPRQINYQGRLTDPGGAPVTDTVSMQFRLYTVATDGTEVYSETQMVPVSNGAFSVLLGSPTPIPGTVPFDQPYYLGIAVGGEAEMTPRQAVAASAYAIRAGSAESLAAGATVPGAQITGAITTATISASQITGAVAGPSWVAATAPAQQAAANTAYLVAGATHVTITMPAAPAVGDTVKVLASPAGGGFTIVPNAGQSFEVSDAVSANWSTGTIVGDWRSIAASADGTRLVAVIFGGRIYTSTDSGHTWTPRESARNWTSVASSADGMKLVAAAGGEQIYTSTDGGVIWTPRDSARNWGAVASSANGNKLAAGVYGGQLFTSTDSGVTWIPRGNGPRNWFTITSSSDGVKLAATESNSESVPGQLPGMIFTSPNSGVNWFAHASNVASEDTSKYHWGGIASSADGTKLVAANTGDRIYTSTDSGTTWTARESARNWLSVASSADGAKLAAGTADGQVFTSSDSGRSWIRRLAVQAPQGQLPPNLYGMASSADGRVLAAAGYPHDYLYTWAFTTISATGTTAAVELVYAGGGVWLEVNPQGALTSP